MCARIMWWLTKHVYRVLTVCMPHDATVSVNFTFQIMYLHVDTIAKSELWPNLEPFHRIHLYLPLTDYVFISILSLDSPILSEIKWFDNNNLILFWQMNWLFDLFADSVVLAKCIDETLIVRGRAASRCSQHQFVSTHYLP